MQIQQLVTTLIDNDPTGCATIAAHVGVSQSTVRRWASGSSAPQPRFEGRLRTLAAHRLQLPGDSPQGELLWGDQPDSTGFARLLADLRELFHREGSLSTRQEALDQVALLLFVHVMSERTTGDGLGPWILGAGEGPARGLARFVRRTLELHLPRSLGTSLSAEDYRLALRDSQDEFGAKLLSLFERHSLSGALSVAPGQEEILNESFGRFLGGAFADEKELGQYLTPPEIVKGMVRLGISSLAPEHLRLLSSLEVEEARLVLDPSCGVGSFLSEFVRQLAPRIRAKHGSSALPRWLEAVAARSLIGVDKSERMLKLSLTNLALFGFSSTSLHLLNALGRSGSESKVTAALEGRAALILTNPPFGAQFEGEGLDGYRIAGDWAQKRPKKAWSEILFLERYLDWLAPNGILVAIVPDSVLTNRGMYRDLRAGLAKSIEILSVISLPTVTFAAAGTQTKTSILHLRKKANRGTASTYFAVCQNIGYDVVTRGSQREKVQQQGSQLAEVFAEARQEAECQIGRRVDFSSLLDRWDATFHIGLPGAYEAALEAGHGLRVSEVASLSKTKSDPRRSELETFPYIEISNVDIRSCTVTATETRRDEAPSRARKKVQAGDVLVSTVRPERKTVAVVPPELDGAICSTGFAVLRPHAIEGVLLAKLLQHDFSNAQILRHNTGIAYPAISEECLNDIMLPISRSEVQGLTSICEEIERHRRGLKDALDGLEQRLRRSEWPTG